MIFEVHVGTIKLRGAQFVRKRGGRQSAHVWLIALFYNQTGQIAWQKGDAKRKVDED